MGPLSIWPAGSGGPGRAAWRSGGGGTLGPLGLDRASPVPLYRQVYQGIREAILGRLRPGARLPSSRTLAADLGVSRNTVVGAFEQLLAEGYVEGRGRRHDVARSCPRSCSGRARRRAGRGAGPPPPVPARRPAAAAGAGTPGAGARAFRSACPAVDASRSTWARLVARLAQCPGSCSATASRPATGRCARRSPHYLARARGVRCDADQVIIVAGAQQALDWCARVLLDPGDAVWVEDPGYPGARGALAAAGARLVPVPVDAEGIDVAAGDGGAPGRAAGLRHARRTSTRSA